MMVEGGHFWSFFLELFLDINREGKKRGHFMRQKVK